jgi:hypothetical protein
VFKYAQQDTPLRIYRHKLPYTKGEKARLQECLLRLYFIDTSVILHIIPLVLPWYYPSSTGTSSILHGTSIVLQGTSSILHDTSSILHGTSSILQATSSILQATSHESLLKLWNIHNCNTSSRFSTRGKLKTIRIDLHDGKSIHEINDKIYTFHQIRILSTFDVITISNNFVF